MESLYNIGENCRGNNLTVMVNDMFQKLISRMMNAVVLCLLLSAPLWAETALDRQGDEIVPGAEFWTGVLERVDIQDNEVVSVIINDTVYTVDANTVVKSAHGARVSLRTYKEKTYLEFYALDRLLTKVMPALEQNPESESRNSRSFGSGQSSAVGENAPGVEGESLRQENGVWKN